jgi:hypothetical protein
VNHAVLQHLHPAHVEVEICRAEELDQRRGLTSELDEMWSYQRLRSASQPLQRWQGESAAVATELTLEFVDGQVPLVPFPL